MHIFMTGTPRGLEIYLSEYYILDDVSVPLEVHFTIGNVLGVLKLSWSGFREDLLFFFVSFFNFLSFFFFFLLCFLNKQNMSHYQKENLVVSKTSSFVRKQVDKRVATDENLHSTLLITFYGVPFPVDGVNNEESNSKEALRKGSEEPINSRGRLCSRVSRRIERKLRNHNGKQRTESDIEGIQSRKV